MIEPLTLSYPIGCPAEHAFDVWTSRFSTWWPPGHSTSGGPDTVVVLETGSGGRIFERTPDGTEIEWGEVVEQQGTGCRPGTSVVLYTIRGGGHSWPGADPGKAVGLTTEQISATGLMLAVFSGLAR